MTNARDLLADLDWRALALPIAYAEDALARLDERLAKSPIRKGWIVRTHFLDATAALWLEGELVQIEDLVLHDAGMEMRTPTHEITRAHAILRTRRRIASAEPGWALSDASGDRESLKQRHRHQRAKCMLSASLRMRSSRGSRMSRPPLRRKNSYITSRYDSEAKHRLACYTEGMNNQEVIARLRECEAELRARGVRHAALFGSVARGAATPESDIDILLDLDADAVGDVYDYVGLKEYVASLFPGPVDVVNRAGLKPYIRPPAEAEAVYAF